MKLLEGYSSISLEIYVRPISALNIFPFYPFGNDTWNGTSYKTLKYFISLRNFEVRDKRNPQEINCRNTDGE